MYRALSLILLLTFAGIAIAFSAMAFTSLEPKHFGIAFGSWAGVVWYVRYRRQALSKINYTQSQEQASVFTITPSVLGVLAAACAVPAFVLWSIGWLERPGIWFLYFVLSGTFAVVALGVLILVRGAKQTSNSVKSTTK